jgi:hypothetical protein
LELKISNQLRTILDELHIINFILHRQREIIVRFHKKLEMLKLDCGKPDCDEHDRGKHDHGKHDHDKHDHGTPDHGTPDHCKLNCGKLHHVLYKVEEYIARIDCLFHEAIRINKAVSQIQHRSSNSETLVNLAQVMTLLNLKQAQAASKQQSMLIFFTIATSLYVCPCGINLMCRNLLKSFSYLYPGFVPIMECLCLKSPVIPQTNGH